MPRTALTPKAALGSYPTLPIAADGADYTLAAADVANGNEVVLTGRELVLVQNVNVGAQTITFTSVIDSFKRTGHITAYSVGPSEFAVFGPFLSAGWLQADGRLYIDASHADIKIAVIRLP